METIPDPHRGEPVLAAGAALGDAKGAAIMVHGRGANAADILGLAESFDLPEIAYVAPEAAGHAWYPYPFLAPLARNEPYRTSALNVLATLIAKLGAAGIPPERVALVGFSQGACLSLELAARNPRRYGGVIGFTGGLMGERIDPADYSGDLAGTPVFIGSSDVDPHIPLVRVKETTAVLTGLGADVTERIYPGMGHTINADEISHARAILGGMIRSA